MELLVLLVMASFGYEIMGFLFLIKYTRNGTECEYNEWDKGKHSPNLSKYIFHKDVDYSGIKPEFIEFWGKQKIKSIGLIILGLGIQAFVTIVSFYVKT